MDSSGKKVTFFLFIFVLAGVAASNVEETNKLKYKEQYAIEGSSYKMKCVGPGGNLSETHYIVWAINGRPPLRGPKYKILTDGLVIRNVSKDDTLLNYTCSALDRLAFIPVYSENIRLKLRQREGKGLETRGFVRTIIGDKVKVWGILSESKTLYCRMYSRPSPTFEWRDESMKKIENSSLYKIMEDETTSNLTIKIVNASQFREYACKAQNNLGESTQFFILAEGYQPKSPHILPTFIGRNRITLRVELQEEIHKEKLPLTSYLIQYATVDSVRMGRKKWNTISRSVEAQGKAGFHMDQGEIFELFGLQENTTYLIRSAVVNVAATSNFSPAVRITTDTERRPVYIRKEEKERKEYGRSSDVNTPRGPDPDSEIIQVNKTNCKPKFKKTVIITTVSTTMFENMIEDNDAKGDASDVVKKRVEEDTKVERMHVCSVD